MNQALSIYIHIPFCKHKCSYCDFCAVALGEAAQSRYLDALEVELSQCEEELSARTVDTIYIGGGTPNYLSPALLERLFSMLSRKIPNRRTPIREYAIECNPEFLSEEKLRLFTRYGINRLSIGLQSTQADDLHLLRRTHGSEDFLRAVHAARRFGFDNINVDLMYAIPGQTPDSLQRTLDTVLALHPEHLSCYSLILEEGTLLRRYVNEGKLREVEDTVYLRAYEQIHDTLIRNGYLQYEISNYAKPGYASYHNLSYWKRRPYLGFGASAFSFDCIDGTSIRRGSDPNVKQYTDHMLSGQCVQVEEEILTRRDAFEEEIFLGMRTIDGISPQGLSHAYPEFWTEKLQTMLQTLHNKELIAYDFSRDILRLTETGIHVSNRVFVDLLSCE